mgnify:CR=1 FL=1
MKHISEIIRKDLGLNRENSSLLDEKTKIFKHLVDKLKDKPYIIENAYLKENILFIECNSAEETEALRYEERNMRNILKKTPRKKFIHKCPNKDCKGFVSTAYKCGICDMFTCSKCLEINDFDSTLSTSEQ